MPEFLRVFDVKKATYLGGYKIKIVFGDRRSGIINFEKYPKRKGVFEKFNDIEFFKKFYVNTELGVLSWPDDIDIAPERLYELAIGSSSAQNLLS